MPPALTGAHAGDCLQLEHVHDIGIDAEPSPPGRHQARQLDRIGPQVFEPVGHGYRGTAEYPGFLGENEIDVELTARMLNRFIWLRSVC